MRKLILTTAAVLLAAIGLAGCSKKAAQESAPETQTAAVLDKPKDNAPAAKDADSGAAVSVKSPTVDDAQRLLNSLYESFILNGRYFDTHFDYDNKDLTSKFFSAEMVELLLLEDKCRVETGEICNINWDILCSCQDMSDKFSINFETKSVNPVQILAHLKDGDYKSELQFNFVVENGRMKISDIIDGELSLKKLLSSPL
jgi:hypothetical protein